MTKTIPNKTKQNDQKKIGNSCKKQSDNWITRSAVRMHNFFFLVNQHDSLIQFKLYHYNNKNCSARAMLFTKKIQHNQLNVALRAPMPMKPMIAARANHFYRINVQHSDVAFFPNTAEIVFKIHLHGQCNEDDTIECSHSI